MTDEEVLEAWTVFKNTPQAAKAVGYAPRTYRRRLALAREGRREARRAVAKRPACLGCGQQNHIFRDGRCKSCDSRRPWLIGGLADKFLRAIAEAHRRAGTEFYPC